MIKGESRYSKNKRVVFVLLIVFLAFGFAPLLLPPNSGLSSTQPMGAYLNGVFTPTLPTGPDSVTYTIENAYPNLVFLDPVKMLELPTNKIFVLGKSGHAWVFDDDPTTAVKTQVLDIEPQITISGDAGMLGAVLHPEFGQSGSPNAQYIYIWYRYKPIGSNEGNLGYMRLSRFTINSSYTLIDPASEYVMIQQYDRHQWHNGGDMFFDPDGFLYIAIGDEGGSNDYFRRTQSITEWLFGGVLRIDVDMRGGAISHPIRRQPIESDVPPTGWPATFTQGYYIPNDNPWLDVDGGILEEFWAIGTRSPHRMTYDPPTGDIWLGDVGQAAQEEISLVIAGANLQWPYREGNIRGPRSKPNPLIGFDHTPVFAYPRSFGKCVIGGYVIRGGKYPELEGRYIFADHVVQNVWTFELGEFGTAQDLQFLLNVPVEGSGSKDGVSSFALGSDGTVYILDLYALNTDGGKIHKLVRQPHGGVPDPPNALSELGVFTDLATLEVAPGIIPYTVNTPLWSDGSEKKRWIAIPNDGVHDTPAEQISFDPDDFWTFPAGTVMIKHFELPLDHTNPGVNARLETRFFIYNDLGSAYGLTYRWNTDGTDAFLVDGEEIGDYQVTRADGSQFTQTWSFPSRQQCLECHNSGAGYALGLKAHQLNGDLTYPTTGITANQLETWDFLNLFDGPIPDVDLLRKSYAIDDITASAEQRVMSYIDANCAHCHRNGQVDGAFDARYHIPIELKGIVDENAIGMNTTPGQKVIAFSDTSNSELWVRDSKEQGEVNIMPPLARSLVDEKYIEVLTEWIMRSDTAHASTARTELDIKVFLEAAWNGTGMDDNLRTMELLPNIEPYHTVYGHVGQGGGEYAENATLAFEEGASVVDWVLVELRHDVMSELVEETYSALLLSDGRVIDPQGGPIVVGTASEDYHVAIRHRNHLGVMTAQPILFGGNKVTVDFSDQQTATWGTDAQKDMSGTNVLWMGNVDASAFIKYTGADNDRDAILRKIGGDIPTNTVEGYHSEDVNMDGSVRYTGASNDRDLILINIGGSVPTNIRLEQLP